MFPWANKSKEREREKIFQREILPFKREKKK